MTSDAQAYLIAYDQIRQTEEIELLQAQAGMKIA